MTICSDCKNDDDCRPYGKGGAMVCFSCAMKDEAETQRNFLAQLHAASMQSNVVILGEQTGPRPLTGKAN
jgi:hypothetical protein